MRLPCQVYGRRIQISREYGRKLIVQNQFRIRMRIVLRIAFVVAPLYVGVDDDHAIDDMEVSERYDQAGIYCEEYRQKIAYGLVQSFFHLKSKLRVSSDIMY